MAEKCSKNLNRVLIDDPEEQIIISGISGRFPNSNNMFEFEHNLYNKIDMVDDDERRWRHEHAEIPKRSGKINNVEKFDATFFGVHFKQAHTMDPQGRILIETAYEAVLDAGINPKSIRNTKVGVFIGACFSESDKTWFYEKIPSAGFGITGCSRAMLANRVSYSLGLNGPSFLVDTACSSVMYALDMAYTSIRTGECEAAIVGASNLLLHPYVTLQFAKLGVLSADGYCRPFDDNASGYTRAETISCMYIQKAKDAKRIYCSLLHSKTNCDGYKEEGITFPSGAMQAKLLKEFYEEVKIKPETVDYVEAHSTGTVVGDPEECHSLDKIFCTNRKRPLPVGSVKSNVGHTEPAAGMCSIAKCILAFEKRLIAPNINFKKNRSGIKSLEENRLQVVSEVQKLDGPLIAVNSFGFGGANAHALIRAAAKEKINKGEPKDSLPRLVNWSGRTEEACEAIFNHITSQPLDAEYIGLLHNTQIESVPGLVFRGYGLFQKNEENATCVQREVQHFTGIKRPIVYCFSGMGSQWAGMGTSLMSIPTIRQTIQKCHNALKPKGIDLIKIITSEDPTTFDNILNSFVGIASIQVAIVDVLRLVGLTPDIIIGHSVGELGCAYADGCLSAEEMVLCAYSRGLASLETKKIRGAMAAVGLGYRKIRNIVPPSIDVACHNSIDSSTLSGPEADIDEFVAKLVADGIFAKSVPCSNIAYHSRYIADMGPKLLGYLSKIITNPKKRSPKWLSTSVPKSRWDNPENQYCTAEYQTNNLLSSVLFEETSTLLPSNALCIEIAPHGLLQAILRKSLPNAVNVPLTQRGNKENLQFFLNALGKIYLAGIDLQIQNIYPPIQFPVSRGTSMISPLVKWDHSEDWFVTKFEAQRKTSSERRFFVKISDQEFEYITGHMIDGRCLFPATGYLFLIWESLSKMRDFHYTSLNIEFTDVKFLRATTVAPTDEIEFVVMIHTGTGRFEIVEGQSAVVTGCVQQCQDPPQLTPLPPIPPNDYPMLPTKDFYKELRLRGYHYNGLFRNVIEARSDGLYGRVRWESNWVAFMDCLMQMAILGKDSRALQLPTRIEKITINTHKHSELTSLFTPENEENHWIEAFSNASLNVIQAGGIEIKGLSASPVSRRKPPGIPVLESYLFVPHFPTPKLSSIDAVRFIVQTAIENNPVLRVKSIELIDDPKDKPIIVTFKEALEDLPLITAEMLILSQNEEVTNDIVTVEYSKLSVHSNCMFIIKSNATTDVDFIEKSGISFIENGFLISRESTAVTIDNVVVPSGFQLIALVQTEDENLVFLRRYKKTLRKNLKAIKISASDSAYKWLDELRESLKDDLVIAYSENEKMSGILGLINCVRKEPNGNQVSCFFIDDTAAPPFDMSNVFYAPQIALDLGVNVYRQGQWGTYRHLILDKKYNHGPTDIHAYVNMLQKGDLSSLKWIRGMLNDQLITNANLVKIHYSSLNFRDVMIATGKLSVEVLESNRLEQECVLGFEYAGINQNGERVMGMVISGALSTYTLSDPALTWKCPDDWDLKEAATIPIVYGTVYAAFFLKAKIQRGKSILIHAGTGGVGLAAIRVAYAYGLKVFTTVSTKEKRQFLLSAFPELKDSHIGNSRDCSFETMIKLETQGRGVDYVLNSLSDDKLHASIRCLGQGGQFLEIGKYDIANNTKIGLGEFENELSFHAVLVDNLFKASLEEKMALRVLVEKDIQSGIIKPLPAHIYKADEVEQAYRFLASAKHIGKVLLKIRENEYDKYSYPISVIPRLNCDPDMSYVIPGGLGGFGLELADWLIIRGARKIVLSSSRGITKPYQSYRIKLWRNYGAEIAIDTSDIATPAGCLQLIKNSIKLGPVGGIFNLAVVLRDSILENQTPDKFVECLGPKANATKYLDEVSRKLCPFLKHFVIFSSVSCGRGNAGQSNYGMANSIMERIMEQRYRDGLPAKAIQWGAVGEVGLVADMVEDKLDMEIGGTLQQRISSCLEELDTLLFGDEALVSSMVVAEKRVGSGGRENIVETIMNIMSIRDIKSVSMDSTLSEMGMDSLMAVEIKQSLEREFEIFLTPQDLRSLTFAKLQELAEVHSGDSKEMKSKLNIDETLTGIHMLIRNLGDEHTSSETLLRLKTLNNSDNFDEATIIIPGVEGVTGTAWHNIAANIKSAAYCLQLSNTVELKTLPEIVKSVLPELMKKIFSKVKTFYLVGYSFGSYITLELASELEKQGMKGKVVLLDGAPDFLKKLTVGQIANDINENSLQIMIASNIVRNLIPDESFEELYEKFVHIPSWAERVDKVIELTKSQNVYSLDYLRKLSVGVYNRVRIVVDTDNNKEIQKITSPITLIRCAEVSVVDIDEDYELYKFTSGVVNLKFIDGNHVTMLENPKLPALINELMHSED